MTLPSSFYQGACIALCATGFGLWAHYLIIIWGCLYPVRYISIRTWLHEFSLPLSLSPSLSPSLSLSLSLKHTHTHVCVYMYIYSYDILLHIGLSNIPIYICMYMYIHPSIQTAICLTWLSPWIEGPSPSLGQIRMLITEVNGIRGDASRMVEARRSDTFSEIWSLLSFWL